MKAVYVKVFAVFMSSLLLFAACKNESDDNSSGVIGTGTVTPSVPATDPVIEDGTYFFDKNTIVTLKANSSGLSDGYIEVKEYVDYAAYQKRESAGVDDEIYEITLHRGYTVEWLGSKAARKIIGPNGHPYYVYNDNPSWFNLNQSFVMMQKTDGKLITSANLIKLDEVKDNWNLPEEGTYVSEKKYAGENYLYVVISSDLKTVTFYNDTTNTASPSGDTNKLGDMQNQKWDFINSMVRASNGDWRVAVRKNKSTNAIYLSVSKYDGNTISGVNCFKKD